MEECCAQDILPNQELATFKNVQLTVSGVSIASGAAAVNHVAEEYKRSPDSYKEKQLMAARNVLEKQPKQEIAPKSHAQLIANGTHLEIGVIAVKIVVAVGKGGLEQ